MKSLKHIRIGTIIRGSLADPGAYVQALVKLGFESIEPFFWQRMDADLPRLAVSLKEAIGDADVSIDTLGMFGNPLEDGDLDRKTLAGWEALIDHAHLFGAKTIAGFTGRVRGKPIEDSLPRFKAVWGALARRAADKGVRLAFENCAMDGNWQAGDWNIAHNPDAWELMFNALPDENLGLEWEPCHQLVYLIDPIRKFANGRRSSSTCTARTPPFAGTSSANTAYSARFRSFRCGARDLATATGPASSASCGWRDIADRSISKVGTIRSIAMNWS